MKCLMKYQWVKLPRNHLPDGKGIMGAWARLASRAAFRKGQASYCGYTNLVSPGMWAGGKEHPGRKKSPESPSDASGAVYVTDGYGFLCLPRDITDRLADRHYQFEEADAWLDLWCHSVWQDPCNAFSFLAPAIQYGKYGALLTLETLGQRWGWEKTKVWRFFQKHGDVFALYRLPGSYGCLIFNKLYPSGTEVSVPHQEEVVRILDEIRICGAHTHKTGSDHTHMNRLVTWYSRRLTGGSQTDEREGMAENRVAFSCPIICAYLSLWNCKNCGYDCQGKSNRYPAVIETSKIRGPCVPVDITKIAKEFFIYEQTG